jgi:hypothetical protein
VDPQRERDHSFSIIGQAESREMGTVHILNTCRFLEQADLIPLFVMFLDIEYSGTY